jgi:hypothetical protein
VYNLHEGVGLSTLLHKKAVRFPVDHAATSVDIDLVEPEESRTLPDVATDPEENNNREGKAADEETLNSARPRLTRGVDARVDLGNEDQNRHDQTNPRTSNTERSLERDLIKSVALTLPGHTETNVAGADRSPGEESSKTRDTKKPVKELRSTDGVSTSKGNEADGQDEKSRVEGATGTVNVGEDLGGVTLLSHCGKGTATTIDTRDTDGDDRDHDDKVHEVVESVEVSLLANNDKGRGLRVGERLVPLHKALVSGRHEKTDEEDGQNEEEDDTPEHHLASGGESLERVLGLASSETNQLGTGKGKSGSDEARAETLEAVTETTLLHQDTCANIGIVLGPGGTATQDENKADDDEDDNGAQLEETRPELLLGVTKGTEAADESEGDKEDGHEDGRVDASLGPVVDCKGRDDNLKGQDEEPLQEVVPAHSETPRGVNEASDEDVETTGNRVHESHLTQSHDDVEHHDTDEEVVEEKRDGATTVESTTSADEETGTNGTTSSNHLQVAALHGLVELVVTVGIGLGTASERGWGHAHAAPERETLVVGIVAEVGDSGVAVGGFGGRGVVRAPDGLLAREALVLVFRHLVER